MQQQRRSALGPRASTATAAAAAATWPMLVLVLLVAAAAGPAGGVRTLTEHGSISSRVAAEAAPASPTTMNTAAQTRRLLQSPAAAVNNSPQRERLARTNGTAVFCISPQPAQVLCDPKDPDANATGYQVELLRTIVHSNENARLGLPEDHEWRCMDWTAMIDDLEAPNGTCFMAAGVDILEAYLESGIVFTWPTITQGLMILTTGSMQIPSMWSMFSAFHWSVWLALFCTLAIVGVLLALFQRCSLIVTDASLEARARAEAEAEVAAEAEAAALMAPAAAAAAAGGGPPLAKAAAAASVTPVAAATPATSSLLPDRAEAAAGGDDVALSVSTDGAVTPQSDGPAAAAADATAATLKHTTTSIKRSRRHARVQHTQHLRRLLRRQLGLQRGHRLAFASHVGDHVWQAFAIGTTISEGGVDPPRSLPGRIVYWAFLLMVMLLMALFTANTAGIVTTMRLSSAITGRADLAGKAVATWDGYMPLLRNTEIRAVQLPWENQEDLDAMVHQLEVGTYKALLLDASAAESIDTQSCDLYTVGDAIQEWGSGFAFPKGTSDAFVRRWNEAILIVQQSSNTMDTLREKFIGRDNERCGSLSEHEYQVHFFNVSGLWAILAFAVLLGFVLLGVMFAFRSHANVRDLALASLSGDAAAGVEAAAKQKRRQQRWKGALAVEQLASFASPGGGLGGLGGSGKN